MTNSLARRVLTTGGVAAALALAAAGPAAAADWPNPKVSTADGKSVIKFLSHTEKETFFPKGGEPLTEESDQAPKAGDAFGFEDVNSQDGTTVGTDSGRCEVLTATEESGTGRCVVKVTFADGTITIDGKTIFTEDDSPFTMPITSGTGAYAGAKGEALIANVSDTDSNVTLTYSTTGSQVSTTPTGGAATGGGIATDSGASSLLALGALGVGAGGLLLAAGRKIGRRSN